MMLATALAIFPAGMLLGILSRVLAHRLPRGEPLLTGRSRRTGRGVQIAADDIPVVSWSLLRGRCGSCGQPITSRYPLIEVGLGALWVGTFLALGDDPGHLALGLVLCTVLVTVTLTDLDFRVIPNELLLAGAIAGIAIAALFDPSSLPERGIAALAVGGLLFPVAFAHPHGMGMGDAKLAAMMGIYLGRSIAPAVVVGFAAGALIGAAMIAGHGAGARKRAIPFGPFLALGGFVGLWFGDPMVNWYADQFLASP